MGNEDPIITREEEAEGTIRLGFSTPTVSEKGLNALMWKLPVPQSCGGRHLGQNWNSV